MAVVAARVPLTRRKSRRLSPGGALSFDEFPFFGLIDISLFPHILSRG